MAQTQANPNQAGDAAAAGVTVLLLDSPENEGVDFLPALKRMGLQFTLERVNDRIPGLPPPRNATWTFPYQDHPGAPENRLCTQGRGQ